MAAKLAENGHAVINAVVKAKPAAAKGNTSRESR